MLITSTIAPPADSILLARKDPALRLADYEASLDFQIGLLKSNIIDAIVYADNSGYPLGPLKDICERRGVSNRVEFISYRSEEPTHLGRYSLEIKLIRRAITLSGLLSSEDSVRIWKLTGRYIVKNIDKIIREAPQCDLYINCRNYPIPWADFFLVAFTREGFGEILEPALCKHRDFTSDESTLRKFIDTKSFPKYHIVKRFERTPRVSGTRGFDNALYSSWIGTLKYRARAISNRIIPTFWI